MNQPSAPLQRSMISLSMITMLLALMGGVLAHAQGGALEITIVEENYAVQSINNPATVDYSSNIELSHADAELTCTPATGSEFPRGATRVDCTATRGDETATAGFYVLVANGDDTDVELRDITQNPSTALPSSQVTYNIEYRANVGMTAREIVFTGTLPAEVTLKAYDDNCNVSRLPTITCTFFALQPGFPQAFQVHVQIKQGFLGDFTFPWSLALAGNQRDLRADNNSFTATTSVQPLLAPNRIYIPLLQS